MRHPALSKTIRCALAGAALLASGLVSAVTGTATAPAHAATTPACPAVAIYAFRGSGDTQVVNDFDSGWEGTVLEPIFARARQLHFPDGGNFTGVQIYGIDYRAVSAANTADFLTNLSGSVQDGVTQGLAAIQAGRWACPNAKIVLAGYSQGALVVRRLALQTKVDGAFLLGDAEQKPNQVGNYGVGGYGDPGGTGLAVPFFNGSTDGFYSLPITRIDYCHISDSICDASLQNLSVGSQALANNHLNYGVSDPKEMTLLANLIANLTRYVIGQPIVMVNS